MVTVRAICARLVCGMDAIGAQDTKLYGPTVNITIEYIPVNRPLSASVHAVWGNDG